MFVCMNTLVARILRRINMRIRMRGVRMAIGMISSPIRMGICVVWRHFV